MTALFHCLTNALLKENIKSTKVTHIETEQDIDQSGAATTVNFHRINSMAFSKPVSLSYFGEVKPESSWKGLYVDACKSLLDDYPDIFTRLKAESLHGSGKTWLVDAENLHLLAVPKQLEEGLFVETNRNASDLVKNLKWLLDECSVDYENVVITYTNKDGKKEASVPAPVTTSAFQKKQYYRQDKEDFYRWLQNDQHMAEGTCRSYVSAIRGAEHFAEEHGLVSRKLYTCDPAVAKATADELFSNAEFIQYNNDQHNRFRAAITKLLVFYGSNWSTIEASTPRTFERSPLQTEEISIDVAPYKTILVEHFSKGYRLESALDMKRMLSASAHKFNGAKGVGFLYIRTGTTLPPYADGGAQEHGLRAGTENVAGIVSMAVALKKNVNDLDKNQRHILKLEGLLLQALNESGIPYVRNGGDHTLPGVISLSFDGKDGEAILHRMDLMGVCISTGSACDSKNTEISHVLQAIRMPESLAKGTIRISLGKNNTADDIDTIVTALRKILL